MMDHRPVRSGLSTAAAGQLDGELPACSPCRCSSCSASIANHAAASPTGSSTSRWRCCRPGAGQPRLRQRRREPRLLLDERLGGRRRRRTRQGRDPGDACAAGYSRRSSRSASSAPSSLIAPVMPPSIPAVIYAGLASRLDRRPVRRVRRPGAADGDRAVRRGLPAGSAGTPNIQTTPSSRWNAAAGRPAGGSSRPLGAPVIILGGILCPAPFTPTGGRPRPWAWPTCCWLLCFFYRSLSSSGTCRRSSRRRKWPRPPRSC